MELVLGTAQFGLDYGVTNHSGLYFMGLQWMYSSKSAQFIGVSEDAKYIVEEIEKKI